MTGTIIVGDCRESLRTIATGSVNCAVTSPPYFGLRDYGVDGQLGLETTPDEFVRGMVEVFREVRRVLRDDGTLWLNIGDSYANDGKWGGSTGGKHAAGVSGAIGPGRRRTATGLKAKDLIGIPWMLAFALRADGWHLRQEIIWHKPNAMPESVKDRCTKAHEQIFLLTKRSRYYFDHEAIVVEQAVGPLQTDGQSRRKDRLGAIPPRHAKFGATHTGLDAATRGGTRSRRSVWSVATRPYREAHFATYPAKLIEPCILAGCPEGGVVLDPFFGAGTTGVVAEQFGRNWIGCELNPAYANIARRRLGLPEEFEYLLGHNGGPPLDDYEGLVG